MSRKRKTSPLESMLDLVSSLPWWVGIAIAVIGYSVLHRLAAPVQASAVQTGQVGDLMTRAVVSGLAGAGQYIVPLVGLVGAMMSFFRRKKRSALVADVAQAKSADALNEMSWREFEMLVGQAYRSQGYSVIETGGGGADEGIDLILTKGGEKFLVQAKQWKAYKVGVTVVRELYGVMAAKGATGGFVVTSGRFTGEAEAFALGRNIQLVDGPNLFVMIKQAKQSKRVTTEPQISTPLQLKKAAIPSCPQCGTTMVKRTARKGSNAGMDFWGCAAFPMCRGVLPLIKS